MDLHGVLVIIHIIGVILGVGGATLAEVFYIVALKDGKVDASEKLMMHANYKLIRVGLVISVLSGIALVLWFVFVQGNNWPLESPKLWVKDIMVVVIIINAWLLTRHFIPMWLGASLSFTSWWGATVLGAWHEIPYTFTEIIIAYIIAIFTVAGILEIIRRHYHKKFST